MVAEKNWTLPKQVHPFHYYITDIAVQKFREKAHVEHKVLREFDLAAKLDTLVFAAADKMQDIVDGANGAQLSKIVEVTLKSGGGTTPDVRSYAVLREIRPNQFPVPRTVGGPGGVGLCVITLIDTDQGAQNFANGRWKPANLALAQPLKKVHLITANSTGFHVTEIPANDKQAQQQEEKSVTKPNLQGPVSTEPASTKPDFPPRPVYTDEFKQRAVALVKGGKSQTDVAAELDISQGTLSRWITGDPRLVGPARRDKKHQEKLDFARQQFELRPFATARGNGGVHQQLLDRFGSSLQSRELVKLRAEVQEAKGVTGSTPKGRLRVDEKTGVALTEKGAASAADGLADKVRDILVDGVARDTKQVFTELKAPGVTQGQVSICLSELMRRKNKKFGICRVAFKTYQMNATQRSSWTRLQKKQSSESPATYRGRHNSNPQTPSTEKIAPVAAKPAKPPKAVPSGDLSSQLQEALQLEAQKKREYDAALEVAAQAAVAYDTAKHNVSALLKQMVDSRK